MKIRKVLLSCIFMLLMTPFARATYSSDIELSSNSYTWGSSGTVYDHHGNKINYGYHKKHANKHFSSDWLDTSPLWYSFSYLKYYSSFKGWVLDNDYYRQSLTTYKYKYHKSDYVLKKYLSTLYVYYYYTQPKGDIEPEPELPVVDEPIGDVYAPAFVGGLFFLLFGLGRYRRSCYNEKP